MTGALVAAVGWGGLGVPSDGRPLSFSMVPHPSVVQPNLLHVVVGFQKGKHGSCKASQGRSLKVTQHHSCGTLLGKASHRDGSGSRREETGRLCTWGWEEHLPQDVSSLKMAEAPLRLRLTFKFMLETASDVPVTGQSALDFCFDQKCFLLRCNLLPVPGQ